MSKLATTALLTLFIGITMSDAPAHANTAQAKQTLLSALMGAGTGAISAEVSGGKAGTGALVGAGTHIIGGLLIDLLGSGSTSTTPSYNWGNTPSNSAVQYVPTPQYAAAYDQPQAYQPPRPVVDPYISTNQSKNIIRQGLMGAASGAIASEVSGGKAGTGALVGAGTQVIGGALMDILLETDPASAQFPIRYQAPAVSYQPQTPMTKKIIRSYNEAGQLIKEEEFWV